MSEDKNHIVAYKDHLLVLFLLISLTVITVAVTSIELGPYNTAAAMVIASVKAVIVLLYFMHLKFDNKIYKIMTTIVLMIFAAVVLITFFDYLYR
ncbi:MAG: cytochrome C oxidase subunit IV family protein [Lentimicrobiaceae bacterium]|nr:cytochrome C oxidase subunit IV family protein [Lentimicrobiaceae bacterium]MCO5265889.1 cytochrome C oxidase subunit IV family protein [Lentimicrobium sp.]